MSDQVEYIDYKINGIEDYSAVLGEAGIEVSQLEPGQLKGHHMRLRLPDHESSWVKTNLSIRGSGQLPDNAWTFSLVLNADGPSFQHGVEVGAGTMVVHRPGTVHDGIYGSDSSVVCFGVPSHCFEYRILREFPDLENVLTGPWNILSTSGQDKNRLISSFQEAFEMLRSTEAIRKSATAVNSIVEELLYGYLLNLFEANHLTVSQSKINSADILAKCEQYFHDHPNINLSVGDLCSAVGVSRRTLSRAFNEMVGIGPATHLRRLRLNSVRKALLKGKGNSKTITDLALSHGFWHLSRFSEQYHQMFNEYPSKTKSRALLGEI